MVYSIKDGRVPAQASGDIADSNSIDQEIEWRGEEHSGEEDCTITKKGELVLNNAVEVSAQRSLAFNVIKKIGSALLRGEAFSHMSIDIQKGVFDTRAQTQTVAEHMYPGLPLLDAASKDIANRFPLCMAYAISCLLPSVINQLKPFNPIIGETFFDVVEVSQSKPLQRERQITAEEPIATRFLYKTSCEHVVNHPPTTLICIEQLGETGEGEDGFIINSSVALDVSFGVNTVTIARTGITRIEFVSGNPRIIEFSFPVFRLKGLLYGMRRGFFGGKLIVKGYSSEKCMTLGMLRAFQPGHMVESTITFGGSRSTLDTIRGTSLSTSGLPEFEVSGSWVRGFSVHQKSNQTKNPIIHWSYRGSYRKLAHLSQPASEERDDSPTEYSLLYMLKSDSRKRPDLVLYLQGELKDANSQKQILEEKQRADRKLRK